SAPPANPSPDIIEDIRARGVDVVTFTSSSTVRNLATLLEDDLSPLSGALVACIGRTTAETAAEFGLEPVVAPTPSIEALIDTVRASLHSKWLAQRLDQGGDA